jgi:hypothetical protein
VHVIAFQALAHCFAELFMGVEEVGQATAAINILDVWVREVNDDSLLGVPVVHAFRIDMLDAVLDRPQGQEMAK